MKKVLLFFTIATFAIASTINVPTDHPTIQAAIDIASTGDVINVAAGTYPEYLHITTDGLTILGAGIDQSIIDLDGLIPYWHYSPNRSFASRAGVLISGWGSPDQIIENVTFKGFTVKNAGLNPPITATGTHTGADDAVTLTNPSASWETNELVGQWVHNVSDKLIKIDIEGNNPIRSYGVITANTATTVTATLAGGLDNDWDVGDTYEILPYEEYVDVAEDLQDDVPGIGIGNGKDISILYCEVRNNGSNGITAGKARLVNTHKYSEGLIVDHCKVSDNPSNGISIGAYVGPVTITHNVCSNNGSPHPTDPSREYRGVGINVVSKVGTISGIIANNKVKDNGFEGIIVRGTKNGTIDGVTVENNDVKGHNSDQDGAGIFLYSSHWYGHPEKCRNVIVRNNKVEKNIRGIVAYNAQQITIEGNKITTDSGSFSEGQGAIKLDGANTVEVKNNDISHCDGTGIRVKNMWDGTESFDNTITGNKIKGALFAGILIDGGAYDNTFTYNTITDTKWRTFWAGSSWEETQADGVFLDSDAGTGNEFHYNNIEKNKGDGMENQLATTVDAECNWWGHYSGPGGDGAGLGDAVNGDIDFVPWLVLPKGSVFELNEVKIEFKKKSNDDKIHLKGNLGYACGTEISVLDDITVTVGPFSETIPGGSVEEKGKDGEKWEYKRPKHGIGFIKELKIEWKNGKFDIHIDKAELGDMSAWPNPCTITIQIGSNLSQEEVTLTEKKDKLEYKKPKGGLPKYNTTTNEKVVTTVPEKFSLGDNYPNPFNPITTINYQLPEASQVTMTVYDIMGRQVKALMQEFQPAGNHSVIWNATNDNGDLMSGGMYFYQIRAGSFQKTHKMILLK